MALYQDTSGKQLMLSILLRRIKWVDQKKKDYLHPRMVSSSLFIRCFCIRHNAACSKTLLAVQSIKYSCSLMWTSLKSRSRLAKLRWRFAGLFRSSFDEMHANDSTAHCLILLSLYVACVSFTCNFCFHVFVPHSTSRGPYQGSSSDEQNQH